MIVSNAIQTFKDEILIRSDAVVEVFISLSPGVRHQSPGIQSHKYSYLTFNDATMGKITNDVRKKKSKVKTKFYIKIYASS